MIKKLGNIIDLSIINTEIDICANIGVKDLKDKTLCFPEGFFEKIYGISNYYLFNCSDFSTYHGRTISKTSSMSSKNYLKIEANGMSKANLYVPIITQYLPRHFRSVAFPSHTSTLACSNLYGWTGDKKSTRKIARKIDELSAARNGLTQHMNLQIGVRAEFGISSINIAEFSKFIKNLMINRDMLYCNTKKLISVIQQGIDGFIALLKSERTLTIEKIFEFGVTEVYLFENIIRGGQNLHILSVILKEKFLSERSKRKIMPVKNFENLELNYADIHETESKLFKNEKNISSESRKMILKIVELIKIDHEYNFEKNNENKICSIFIETIVENLCKTVSKSYNIDESCIYLNNENSKRFNQTPISSKEILNQYFESPPVKMCNSLYYGVFKFLQFKYELSSIVNLILARMKTQQIRYFVKFIFGKGPRIRKISYCSYLSDEEIERKILVIKSSIRIGNSNNGEVKKAKKAPNTTLVENIMIYKGLFSDESHTESSKQALLDDMRYPFYIYAEKHKVEKDLQSLLKIEKDLPKPLSEVVSKIDINKLSLDQIVEYLNTSDRYVKSIEALNILTS